MRSKRFWAIFIIYIGLGINPSFAQDVGAIIKIANTHFKNESYFKAASFYLKALDAQPNNIVALYQIAESYREITNYHNAEYYYEQVLQKSEDRYPLCRYYYALTQKYNGKYEEALNNFQTFIANVNAGRYAKLRATTADVFSEQARIEREGCLLALKELSKPVQAHEFKILGEPVNSVDNDYAPYVYHSDSTIVITSARSDAKGGNFDNKFGESFHDLFRYDLIGDNWKRTSSNDRFDKFVNSKYHDGSGVFNNDFTSFYFTHCDESGCKIYVTKNLDGKWVEAVPLNTNINANRSNSQHPSLTPTGDTLFFVSDRVGGMGDWDIWMSIAARENAWGPAKNLGDHINTAFPEVSPFFDAKEKALFFASAGHKGHGGLDIFMAENVFDPSVELYNMGLPYNSSRDDAFFILGEHIGFLASNREGGVGKLDIYSFVIESDEEIIAEILNFKEVASRNSLFSSDYEFENTDTDKIEEIISHNVASRLHGVTLSLTEDELAFYNNLSEADRSRIDRIVNTRLKAISSSDIIAVRHEDEFFYQQLNSDFKYHVDKMVTLYLEDYEVAPAVKIQQEDKEFYESLNVNTKEKVDSYIAFKLDEFEDLDLNDQYYSSLDPSSKNIVDDISVNYLRNKSNLDDLSLSDQDLDFLNSLGSAKRAQTELSISNQVASISSLPEFDLGDGERIFYRNLTGNEKSSLDNIAQAYIQASVDDLENFLDPQDLAVYNNLSPVQQESFDKILAKRIQNFIKADKYTLDVIDERDLLRMTELQLSGDADVFSILQDEGISDTSPLKVLAEEDKDRFTRLLSSASNLIMLNTSSKLKEVALSVERGRDIEELVNESNDLVASSMTGERQSFYTGLSPEERTLFNEVLTTKLNQYVDSSESFLANDYASNPNLVSRLEQRLYDDFNIETLLASEDNDYLTSIAGNMTPERREVMSNTLASAAKALVLNNSDQFQELSNREVLSPQFLAEINASPDPALSLASRPTVANNTSRSGNINSAIGNSYRSLPAAQPVESAKRLFQDQLPPAQLVTYNSLTPTEQQFVDQALTVKMQEYIDTNDEVLNLDTSADSPLALDIEDQLADDFRLESLEINNNLIATNSIASKPGTEKFQISGLMANAAKIVLNDQGNNLRGLVSTTPSISSGSIATYGNLPTQRLVQQSAPQLRSNFTADQQDLYNSLTPTEREAINEAVALQLQEYVNSEDPVLLSTNPAANQRLNNQLNSDLNFDRVASDPKFNLPASLTNRSPAQRTLLSGILSNATKSVISNSGGRFRTLPKTSIPTGTSTLASAPVSSNSQALNSSINTTANPRGTGPISTGQPRVAQIIEADRTNLPTNLSATERSVVNGLTPAERQFVDEALSEVISGYVAENSRIIDLIDSSDPQYNEIIEAKLASDFNISSLSSGSNTIPSSLANRSPSFNASLSNAMSTMAQDLIAKRAVELKSISDAPTGGLIAENNGTNSAIPSGTNSFTNSTSTRPTGNNNNAPVSTITQPVNTGMPAVANMVEGSRSYYTNSLSPSEKSIYSNLSPEEKLFVDQSISEVVFRLRIQ